MNPLGCQLLMRISADPDFDNLFRTLETNGEIQKLVEAFGPDFGVVCEAHRMTCKTTQNEVVHLEFTVHRLEPERFLIAFRDVTPVVINEMRVAQSLRNLENLIKSIARLQVETREVEIVLEPLLKQVAQWVGSEGAVLLRAQQTGSYDLMLRVGKLLEGKDLQGLGVDSVRVVEDASSDLEDARPILIAAKNYALVTSPNSGHMDEEAYYLIKLFVQAAAQALENAALQEQLVRQERLSAVGQAMGSVVHDLRSPIVTIKTAIEMAELKIQDPKLVTRMHAIVLRSADSAFAMVNEMLDFVRDAPVQRTETDVAELLAEVVENCEPASTRSGATLEVGCGVQSVWVDRRKLVRALTNLVNNACEALEQQQEGRVNLSARYEEGWALFKVSDNGKGIPEAIRASLFEPFISSGKTGGTGLGLAISQQIVKAHAGSIAVESSQAGTLFTIRLPVANHS